jgi:hypothetical protein
MKQGLFMKHFANINIVFFAGCILFSGFGPGYAFCDLSTFDRTPPRAVRSDVSNEIASFEWATDADVLEGQNWIWHVINNKDPGRGVSVVWPKAKIRQAIGNPLPPGKAACNRYFVNSVAPQPDDDAPLLYGTGEHSQNAAVFVPLKTTAENRRTDRSEIIIETSYTDSEGKVRDAFVELLVHKVKGGDWRIEITQSDNVFFVLAVDDYGALVRLLNSSQREFDRRGVQLVDGYQWEDRSFLKELTQLYSAQEVFKFETTKRFTLFRLFKDKMIAPLDITAFDTTTEHVDMILLDSKTSRPIFATDFDLIVPIPVQRNG